MRRRFGFIYRPAIAAAAIAVFMAASPVRSAHGCGWWGDGEASDSDDAVEVDAEGRPIKENSGHVSAQGNRSAAKVPGAMGYGIAIRGAEQAAPYLGATGGVVANRIDQLAVLGFAAVIDLGTPPDVATLHRAETEHLGMRYFNIPDNGEVPSAATVARFAAILGQSENRPLLVFSGSKKALAMLWTSYRISAGSDQRTAAQEGQRLIQDQIISRPKAK